MIDIKTKNISFLKISKELRDKGVKNNKHSYKKGEKNDKHSYKKGVKLLTNYEKNNIIYIGDVYGKKILQYFIRMEK